VQVKKHVLCFQCEALVIISPVHPTVPHDRSHLILCAFELLRCRHLNKHNQRTPATVCLLISRVRNIDYVIARETEYRSQRFEHAENQVRPSIKPDFLAHGPVSRSVSKQVLQHVCANHTDAATSGAFTL